MHQKTVAALLLPIAFASLSHAAVVTFDDFSSTAGLVLNGNAQGNVDNGIDPDPVLRLTPSTTSQSGSAFSQTTLNSSTFSTFFQFRITDPGGIGDAVGESGADGLVFVIQPISSSIGGAGVGLGYAGISPSVGIEFDTWMNAASNGFASVADPSSNHVGVDINGNVHSVETANVTPRFDDGNLWSAWIDYDGTTLEVRLNQTGVRPVSPVLEYDLDIPTIIGVNDAYVGFTAATGAAYGNHDIVNWTYRDSFDPVGAVPEPTSLLTFAGLASCFGFGMIRRRRRQAA